MLIEDFGEQLSEEGKEHLRRISLAAAKMGELVDDLLQFSRLGRTQLSFRMVDLSELAEASVSAYKSLNPDANAMIVIQPGLRSCGAAKVAGDSQRRRGACAGFAGTCGSGVIGGGGLIAAWPSCMSAKGLGSA